MNPKHIEPVLTPAVHILTCDEIQNIFTESGALLQGHFLLTSGKHSNRYVQCAQALKYPHHTHALIASLREKIRKEGTGEEVDLVVGPAMGGVIVAYEMGRQMGLPALFTEREAGTMTFRRGFQIQPGQRVLVVEDVITTGGSVQEAVECVEKAGGAVTGAAVLVDRSGGKHRLTVPLTSLFTIDIQTYEEGECPLCADSAPVKPGSRNL